MIHKNGMNKAIALGISMLIVFGGIFGLILSFQLDVKGDPPFADNEKVNDDVGTSQSAPSIAVDLAENLFIAWHDDRNVGEYWDIYFSNSSDGGQTWYTDIKVNTNTGNQTNPSLAVDKSTGKLYCAWEDDYNGNFDIYFANSTDGGATWSPNVKINKDATTQRQTNPALVVDSSGDIYAVWEDKRDGNWDIYFSKSGDGGATWSDNVSVSYDVTNADQRYPSIAVGTSGKIYVVWEDERNGGADRDIYFAMSNDGGIIWTNPNIKVNDGVGASQRYPSIAVNLTGNIYVCWQDYRDVTDSDIYFSKSSGDGTVWTSDVIVNDDDAYHQYSPSIAEEKGIIAVVWEDYRDSGAYGSDIYFANSTNGGVNWTHPNLRVNTGLSAVDQSKPSIVMSSIGVVYVTWEDERNGIADPDIFFSKLEPPAIPTVDDIILTESPGGTELDNVNLPKEGSITIYASGFNSSSGLFIRLVNVDWTANPPTLGSISPSKGASTIFTAGTTQGSVVIDGTNATDPSLTDDFTINILPEAIDYVIITDAPNGIALTTVTLQIGETVTAYASGYNFSTGNYIALVEVEWSVDPIVGGSFDNDTGTSTTFTAQFAEGVITLTGQNLSMGPSISDSFELTIEATIDYIVLTNSPGGVPYTTETMNIGSSLIVYASGYNSTGPYYVGLVDVSWSQNQSLGSFEPEEGSSTTFTAGGSTGIVNITGENSSIGKSDTFEIEILDLEIDYINVTDVNKIKLTTINLNAGQEVTIYAYAYNESYSPHMNLGLVDVDWAQSIELGTLSKAKGSSTTFIAGNLGGTTTISATNTTLDLSDDFELTVIPPEVDYIQIVDTSGTGTTKITDQNLNVGFTITGFAAAFNNSVDYIGDIQVSWSVINEGGAGASTDPLSSSVTSTFSSGSTGGTATWVADDGQGHSDTVVFTINSPTIDYIQIRDAAGGAGNIVTTVTYNSGATDTFYAAAYNKTVGYLYEVEATWTCDDTIVGNVTSPGNSTTFTAQEVSTESSCAVTATYDSLSNSTGLLTVLAPTDTQKPNPPGQPTLEVKGKDTIGISWPANSEPDLDHYVIQRATNQGGPWLNVTNVDKNTISYTDKNLKSGTKYYYQIIAVDEAGNPSDPSPTVSAKTESEAGFPWILLIVIIIIVLVVILLMFLMMKKKKG